MMWIVAAPGPSLTPEIAEQCRGHKVMAINDAWRLLPFADVLYACDATWWDHKVPRHFCGERWTSWSEEHHPENVECARRHGLKLIRGALLDGFSFKPGLIHLGSNSGFQGINLALGFGATRIVLVGFDMKPAPDGRTHFFGNHVSPLFDPDATFFDISLAAFSRAAELLPSHVRIINTTPGSALQCFENMSLESALEIGEVPALRSVSVA